MLQRDVWHLSVLSLIVNFIHSFNSFIYCIHAKKDVITNTNDEMMISREKKYNKGKEIAI